MEEQRFCFKDVLFVVLGSCIYASGLVTFNIANDLAEDGITRVTLILRALFHFNPAHATLLINVPFLLIGGRILDGRSLYYTLIDTVSLSVFLWFWQKFPVKTSLDYDLLTAALLAGLAAGFGSGLVYHVGGATGGTDVIARVFEKYLGTSMGRSLLLFDVAVLPLSLIYIDVKRMVYTLIIFFVFSCVVDSVFDGAYTTKGILIVSSHSEEVDQSLMASLERGVTHLDNEGAYSQVEKRVLYTVVSPREVMGVKRIANEIDEKAFMSIVNVHGAVGEGFTYAEPSKQRCFKLRQ